MEQPLRLIVNGTRTALMEERLIEFYQEQAGAQSVVGCVFLGRWSACSRMSRLRCPAWALAKRIPPLRESESYHRACGSAPLMTGQEGFCAGQKD